MAQFTIDYSDRETIVDRIREKAAELNLSPEELIKRFVDDGMNEWDDSPSVSASSLDEFLVKNGALKPTNS